MWNGVLAEDPVFGPASGFVVGVGARANGRYPLIWVGQPGHDEDRAESEESGGFAPAEDIFEALNSIPGIHKLQTNQSAGAGAGAEPAGSPVRQTQDDNKVENDDIHAIVAVFDVDGVIAPIGGPTAWGDDVTVGDPEHQLFLSPSMCAAIDRLDGSHAVGCYWLTDWTYKMRHDTTLLPGREWPMIAEPLAGVTRAEEWAGEWWDAVPWWKWWALDEWLTHYRGVRRLVWIDDGLADYKHNLEDARPTTSPARRAWTLENALRTGAGLDVLLLSPDKRTGLRPLDLEIIEYWVLGIH